MALCGLPMKNKVLKLENRVKLNALLDEHDIGQTKCAEILCKMTGIPCSVRAVRSWVCDPEIMSARTCNDWVIENMEKYIAQKKKKEEG